MKMAVSALLRCVVWYTFAEISEVLSATIIGAMSVSSLWCWRHQAPLKTSVNFYQTTRRNNPEGSHLHVWFLLGGITN
jgi:hypothetical protein